MLVQAYTHTLPEEHLVAPGVSKAAFDSPREVETCSLPSAHSPCDSDANSDSEASQTTAATEIGVECGDDIPSFADIKAERWDPELGRWVPYIFDERDLGEDAERDWMQAVPIKELKAPVSRPLPKTKEQEQRLTDCRTHLLHLLREGSSAAPGAAAVAVREEPAPPPPPPPQRTPLRSKAAAFQPTFSSQSWDQASRRKATAQAAVSAAVAAVAAREARWNSWQDWEA